MSNLAKLEDAAIAIMRKALCDAADAKPGPVGGTSIVLNHHTHRPIEAGFSAQLADVVRDAHEDGRRDVALYVRAAWAEFIESDDLDALVEALAELPGGES